MVVGYPLGLRHRTTNLPLVRQGIIATNIGETLEDEYTEHSITRKRTLRGFLIDGATVPGQSGSPVLLKPALRPLPTGGGIGRPKPTILGIVAETMYAPVRTDKWDIQGFAGLGLAFDAETIKETIELGLKDVQRIVALEQ